MTPRVLYLTHRVPYAPNRGDRIRAYHTLRVLKSAGFQTHVVSFAHDDEEAGRRAEVETIAHSCDVLRIPQWRNRSRAALALAGSTPLTHILLGHPAARALIAERISSFKPDVIVAFCSGMARFAMDQSSGSLPFVLDMVDLDSAKWAALSESARWPLAWVYDREARCLARFEREACERADAVLAITAREALQIQQVAGATAIVVPNGIDATYFRRPSTNPRPLRVVFTAVFDYGPNETGAAWTINEVWPRVLALRPDAELVLAGARPTDRLRRLASAATHVRVTGAVDDMRPYLWDARAAIAPLTIAHGTQNKVLEAVAAGLRCVVTSAVAAGLPPVAVSASVVADTPTAFATAIARELESDESSPTPALLDLRWESCLDPLVRLLTRIADGRPAAGQPRAAAGAASGR